MINNKLFIVFVAADERLYDNHYWGEIFRKAKANLKKWNYSGK
jgi:hypothetical protein